MFQIDDGIAPLGQDDSKNENDALSLPGARDALARQILEDIDAYCETAYDGGHRHHLGASQIGHECPRYLWSVFRWLKKEKFDGRKLRLFNRGHREEARFIEWLKGIGAEVIEFQPDAEGNLDKGEQQYRIKAVQGHFGGSLDGQIKLPERYGVSFGLLAEFKTKGTGRGFVNLQKEGVKRNNHTHYAQMCSYGYAYGYKYALYLAINKNDDTLHVEVVELDWRVGEQQLRKAEDIIMSPLPPVRIAQSPVYQTCKWCHMSGICFKEEPPEKNCRSCQHAKPVNEGEWHCAMFDGIIPKDFLAQGCDQYGAIINGA